MEEKLGEKIEEELRKKKDKKEKSEKEPRKDELNMNEEQGKILKVEKTNEILIEKQQRKNAGERLIKEKEEGPENSP